MWKQRLLYTIVAVLVVLLLIFSDSPFVQTFGKVSTVLLTVFTAGYVVLTYWILKSTRDSAREQARPYVIASLPHERYDIYLSVKNIGARPAKNVRVHFEPALDVLSADFESMGKPLLYQAFMQPNLEVRNPFAQTIEVLKLDAGKKVVQTTVTYDDLEGHHYSHDYTIDINSYLFNKKVIHHDVEHYLEQIASSLNDLRK